MEFFSTLGWGIALLGALAVVLTVAGVVFVYIFWRTRKIVIPSVALLLVSGLEFPVKRISNIFHKEPDFIDKMISRMVNVRYEAAFARVPYSERAVFMPQCLRHPECPARLTVEGIQCVNCGRCGLGEIKAEAERLGYRFFIAPGSSLIKRMMKKFRPKAVLGVGCPMEAKEGSSLVSAAGIPVQNVYLGRDGCVDTRVDVKMLLDKLLLADGERVTLPPGRVDEINSKWAADSLVGDGEVEAAQEKYLKQEKKVIDLTKLEE